MDRPCPKPRYQMLHRNVIFPVSYCQDSVDDDGDGGNGSPKEPQGMGSKGQANQVMSLMYNLQDVAMWSSQTVFAWWR